MPAPRAADAVPSRSPKKDPARKTPANGVNKKPSQPATSPAPAPAKAQVADEPAAKSPRKSPAAKPAKAAKAGAVATADSEEKSVAKSRGATKRPRTAPRARAGGPPIALVGLLVAMGAGGGVGGALFFANSKSSDDVAIAPVASSIPVAVAPAPAPVRVAAAPSPDATATAAAISAAQRLLLSGNEREALDLLASCAPSPEVDKAREGILARCREVLVEEGNRLRRLTRQGKDPAPHMANLRQRLPDSLRGEVDKLALALRQELAPIPTADAEDVAPTPTELSEPAPAEEEEAPAEEEPAEEEPAVAERPAPRPPERPAPKPPAGPSRQPTPPADEPTSDDEPFTPPPPSAEEQGDAVMIAALRELLHVQPRLRAGVADITYAFESDAERLDFEMRGFDKAEINAVHGAASGHTASGVDLELGAGSRATARLQHVLDLAGDFEIDMNVWVGHSSGRSNFMMIMGKVGVRWGEQLVKLTRSSMKPLGPEPDRMAFREERDVNIKMIRRGDELKVLLNGRQVACKTFEPSDLDGKFAIVMGDLRLIVTSLRINGKVDGSKL